MQATDTNASAKITPLSLKAFNLFPIDGR
jgi:hypothetical protein